ncbi:MAG: hypothetical protein N4A40_15030 [Tissierellales bacterium]|jgi:hypothetical protein|nr:hypothetical protein [Tissierellales bacterium]
MKDYALVGHFDESAEKLKNKELKNQNLINKCQRIKSLIAELANTEAGQNIYGARYHHYELMPPVSLDVVREFEREHGIELPLEYVYYIVLVGSGGAGPGNGFDRPFPESAENGAKWLSQSSQELSKVMSREVWEAKYGSESDIPDDEWVCRTVGTISLTAIDTTFLAYLVVTGERAGRVVYLDWEDEYPPVWPKCGVNFLEWCEAWFSGILSGRIKCAGNFMGYETEEPEK